MLNTIICLPTIIHYVKGDFDRKCYEDDMEKIQEKSKRDSVVCSDIVCNIY